MGAPGIWLQMRPPQASHERQMFVEIEIQDPPHFQVSNSLGLHLSSLFSVGETEAKGGKDSLKDTQELG